ncbi:hypothetical protein RZP54_27980 [Raoultella ornithinolytica]|uniref:hypothetical protein n=2 Tax=Klebsiella/Raoultella group TaxID=2890311 RepID=UPI00292C9113|nr:hypothetical protein [Raoultella ornithinolytica]MDV0592771.1 hypothetical protein [Raoultella ornithinolytica]
MDDEMMFSLSYEQMTQMAEEEIKQCDFRRDGTHYVWEVNKAHDILRFWYLLALRGHTGLATTRVEADYKRLKTLISRKRLATAACESGYGIVSLELHLI